MVINHNLQALSAADSLNQSSQMLSKSLARLSSGSKLVNAADDAAGTAVAARLDAQIKRLDSANANIANANSFLQTTDGYLRKMGNALDRMSELSMLAQDGTKSDADRSLYNQEFVQLQSYINTTGNKDFNGVSLFSGASINVTIDSEGNSFAMAGVSLSASSYANATATSVDLTTASNAASALNFVKVAIAQLSTDRAKLGAYESRLSFTSDQLTVSKENLSAASSQIQDVDVAEESTQYARYNILVQAGTAMLSQANSVPQNVLRLLQQ